MLKRVHPTHILGHHRCVGRILQNQERFARFCAYGFIPAYTQSLAQAYRGV